MEIHKCDRYKCLINGYTSILFQGINQNIIKEEKIHPFAGFVQKYENKTWELCVDCAVEIFHWLAHQENELKYEQET